MSGQGTTESRVVTVMVTFQVKPKVNVTGNAWEHIDEAIDRFIDDAVETTVLDTGAIIDVEYARNVEWREARTR
jgi:hypothetical protein